MLLMLTQNVSVKCSLTTDFICFPGKYLILPINVCFNFYSYAQALAALSEGLMQKK